MLFALDYVDNINVFNESYLKLTSPEHIRSHPCSSIYQLMFIIFKLTYDYHCSFQNVSFSLTEKSTVANRRFSLKKFLEPMIGVSLIVFPFFKNSSKSASDMTCFKGKNNRT